VTKTNALETLVIASFVRGLSVRDVESTLAEALGDQAAISKSTVSEVCKAIRAEVRDGYGPCSTPPNSTSPQGRGWSNWSRNASPRSPPNTTTYIRRRCASLAR